MPTSLKVRYQADENPPGPLAFGLGLQYAVLTIAGIVLTPAIVIRAAGLGDPLLTWAAFAALVVSGVTTIVQARRVGHIGAGYILLMGTSGAFIAVCVTALIEGGPALLATLVIISSLFQFLLAWRLSWLRRIVTPIVGGTVIMLIAVTVMPIIFGMLTQVPPDAPAAAAPVSAFATLALIMGIVMRGRGYLRLWAPVVGVAIQRVSWRHERAVDYRAVQGAVNADGLGNLLSGLLGTIPNTTYSTSVAVAELTGVGARVVGVYIGALFLVFAFLPKITAVLLAIPGPVAGAYIMVLLSMLFVLGMKIVIQDGVDYKKGAIVGVAFWIGVGFQHQLIFADRLGGWWGALLGNGMTAGGLAAIVLSLTLDLTGGRRVRMEAELNVEALPKMRTFLQDASRRAGWEEEAMERLSAAAEETVLSLLDGDAAGSDGRRLLVIARAHGEAAELEFVAAGGGDNLEDRMVLGDSLDVPTEQNVSLRLLRHFASEVRHQQYHDTDIVTVRVERTVAPQG